MRKILLFAIMAVTSVVANAQQLQVNKSVRFTESGINAPAKAASVEGTDVWGYFLGGADEIAGLGTTSTGTFRVAIYVPGDGVLKGAKIQGINLPVNTAKMSSVSVWGGKKLGGTELFSKSVSSVSVGFTQVVLDDAVEVPEEGMYVGYTFTISSVSTQAEQYPIGVAEEDEVAGSLYLGLSATAALEDYAGSGYGVSALQLLVSDMKLYDNAANISSVVCYAAAKGGKGSVKVNLASDSNNGVNTVGYKLVVNGVETTGTTNVTPAIAAGLNKSGSVNIEFDAPETVGAFPSSIAITEVNGAANEGNTEATSFTVSTVTRVVPRVSVIEEFTGTGCGFCPRGWVGMEYVKENRPDNAIVIAWHKYNSTDPMYVAGYASLGFDGAPQCCVDRKTYPDPYYGEDYTGIHHTVDAYSAITPTVDITSATALFSADNKQVTVNADAEFLTNVSNYTIAFVLTADGLAGTTSSWKQSNYYYQYTKASAGILSEIPGLGDFCSGGSMGKSSVALTFNDVLIASTYSSNKSTVAAVTSAEPDEVVSREATIKMPTKTTLVNALNYDKVYANILIIDDNGYIANAKRVQVVPDPTGISSVSSDATEVARYTLDGKQINGEVKGVNIVKMSDGTVKKVLVQ